MIILITGASHTGKTLLAQRLLERFKFPYLSIDHLKMGLIRSGQTKLTPCDDEELTPYLWNIVREMIKTAIKDNTKYLQRCKQYDCRYFEIDDNYDVDELWREVI